MMMPLIHEQYALKDDVEQWLLSFRPIPSDQCQILLIYDASSEIHKINLRNQILDFLIKQGATSIENHIITSIHFRLEGKGNHALLSLLNSQFKKFVSKQQIESNGKIFWIFQIIQRMHKKDDSFTVALLGKGNKSRNDRLQENLPSDQTNS